MPRITPSLPRITLRRLVLATLISGPIGVAVLAVGVAAGWWSAPVAVLIAFAAAILAGLAVLATGLRRVLDLLHAGSRHTVAQRNQLDQLHTRVGQLHTQDDQLRAALVETAGAVDRAATRVDGALRDLRAATGEDRLELLQRLEQVTAAADRVREEVRAVRSEQAERIGALERTTNATAVVSSRLHARLPDRIYAKVEAQLGLLALVEPRAPLPPLGGWALDADTMHAVAAMMWRHRPELVVECGSGSSSVWLGYLAERLRLGRVVSLEHDERFLRSSRAQVAAHGLDDLVEIRHAPLVPWTGDGGVSQPWYDPAALDDLKDIGLLLVDGPPQAVGRNARYPAGPLLIPRCTAGAVIVLDDTDRVEERTVSRRWLDEWPDLERQPPVRTGSADIFLRVPAPTDAGGGHDR
jgi:hypothetical protein